MATNSKPPIIKNGFTTTIGFPASMSQKSIQAALAKQGQPKLEIKNTGGDKGLANRATAKPAQKPAASTAKSNSAELKNRPAAKAPVKSTPAKTVSSGPSAVGGGYDGNAFLGGAMDQFGFNPSLQYTPVDTSKIMDLLGKWDPNSIGDVYKPAYENLDRLRTQGRADYDAGDLKLADMYDGLQNNIRNSAVGIRQGYDDARNNINADAQMLSGAASQDAMAIQNNRSAMLKNLGIEAAAPDLVANDNAAAQTGQRVTQAAGIQSGLASTLGANAYAYTQNTANNAGLQGNESRANLLGQLNDYMGDLAGKQSDIDASKAQAINTGYQNHQDAARQLGLQKMQFDMQNAQNSYNAANQNNQNAMSMYGQYNDQQSARAKADADAQAAYLQAQSDADKLAYQRSQDDRQYALDRQKVLNSGGSAPKDLYSVVGNYAASQGVSGTNLNAAMSALNGLAARSGLGNSPGAFADAAAKIGVPGIAPNVLAGIAAQYWQASGAKASGNVYS